MCLCKEDGNLGGIVWWIEAAVRALLSWHGVDEVALAAKKVGGADRKLVEVAFFRTEE